MTVVNPTLTDDQAQALAAWCQWELGDARWATRIASVLAHPATTREFLIGEGLGVESIDRSFRKAFPDRYDALSETPA